jgi:hypothetical protein
MSRFEDGPPNVPSAHRNVVDLANELCMAARKARAKLALKTIAACSCCGKPAVVNGLCREHDEEAFYAKSRALPAGEQFE